MSLPTCLPLAIGDIARQFRVPVHRVRYVIDTRQILPRAKIGNARVFTESDVELIGSELRRIDSERGARE